MRSMRVFLTRFCLGSCLSLSLLLVSGCASVTAVMAPGLNAVDTALPVPKATFEFVLDTKHDDVIGDMQVIKAHYEDTLSDLARRFNLGYEEIVAANPGVDPWVPGEGTEIIIPTQWVLPAVKREGIVVNLAAMRLFYFPKREQGQPQTVITHPVGIGRVDWNTPQGTTRIIAKQEAPAWIPTPAIRKEHADNGDPLPARVPPGPDNPMGSHVLRLGWPEYAIHGTDKPPSIGLRGTHGCLRMYPEDIVSIYEQVPVGTPVTVINEPFLAGFRGDVLMVQTYPVLEDDKRKHNAAFIAQLKRASAELARLTRSAALRQNDQTLVKEMMRHPRALTLPVTGTSVEQQLATLPRVQNRLPTNATWDGKDKLAQWQPPE